MEQKSKVIDDITYSVTQMDAISALEVQTKLIKIIGPGILGLVGQKDISAKKIQEIIPSLINNFDDEIVNSLILKLFKKGVFYNDFQGTPHVIEFSTYFIGKMATMWKVAGFILEVNFNLGELLESISPITNEEESTEESTT